MKLAEQSSIRYVDLGLISFRVDMRTLAIVVVATIASIILALWALSLGTVSLPFSEVISTLLGRGDGGSEFIVMELRLPRVLSALLVGGALAMAGTLLQRVIKNPLVSPDIIGINAGASAAAVYWIISGLSLAFMPVAAFGGAVVSAAIVYILSRRGRLSTSRLILVGIGMNALLTALVRFFLIRGRINVVQRAYQWMAGSLYSSTWEEVFLLLIALAVLGPVGGALLHSLRALRVGESTAQVVGIAVEPTRLAAIAVSCGLSAVAVATSGPIVFVALVVPHIARMITGSTGAGTFIAGAVLGGILLLGADMVGQHLLPMTIPAGVITAALGAPYFLFLLYRSNKGS